jgi:SlyX protein
MRIPARALNNGRSRRNVGDGAEIMDENRVIEIETRLAHQEHLLIELNEVLTDQQVRLGRLEELCNSLIERFRAMAEDRGTRPAPDERPPHY